MLRPFRDLLIVVALIAFLGRFLTGSHHQPAQETSAAGLTLDGVRPGMDKESVMALLGPPASAGNLSVGTPPQTGSYAEWDTGAKLTWQGRPTVTFWPDGTVLAVVGETLLENGKPFLSRGDLLDERLTSRLGPRDIPQQGSTAVFHRPEGDLAIRLDGRKVARMVWSDPGRLTFNGLKPGDSLHDTEARRGPPDFKNPQASFQQWEHPLTQIHYAGDQITEVGGSGTGVLSRGGREILRCGQPEEAIIQALGAPQSQDGMTYHYQGLEVFCGSESQGRRQISSITLKL